MARFGSFWLVLARFGWVWLGLARFGSVLKFWVVLGRFGWVWLSLGEFGPFWLSLGRFGSFGSFWVVSSFMTYPRPHRRHYDLFFWTHSVSSKIGRVSPSVSPSVTKVLILPAIGFLSFFA